MHVCACECVVCVCVVCVCVVCVCVCVCSMGYAITLITHGTRHEKLTYFRMQF